jgi:glycosyltransferase involved in cell wall biosynthesis
MVVLVAPIHPFRGGIADTTAAFAQSLIQQGEEVCVISFTTLYPKLLFPGKTQYATDQKELDFATISTINTLNPFSWLRTAKRIKSLKPKLVVFRYWTPWLAMCYASIAKNITAKKVAWVDNALPHERKTADKFLLNTFLGSVDEVLCMSSSVSKELKKHTQKNITTSFHPVDIDLPAPISQEVSKEKLALDPSLEYLLFFGLIRPYKGLDLLIKSLPQLRQNKPNVRLLVVGEPYEPMRKYRELVASLKVDDMVFFHDRFVATAQIPLWFGACDWVVQPYKSATQSGITPMAIQYGKPSIVTHVGSLSDGITTKTGLVCEPNYTALSQTIAKALTEKKYFSDVRAYKSLQEMRSWSAFCKEFVNTYIKT